MQFEVKRVSGRPGPARAVLFHCHMTWDSPAHVALVGVEGKMSCGQRVVSDTVRLDGHPSNDEYARLVRGHDWKQVTIAVPLTDEALSHIERVRNGSDLVVDVELILQFQRIHSEQASQAGRRPGSNLLVAGEWLCRREPLSPGTVAQSEWVRVLGELEWSELEIFEIPWVVLEPTAHSEGALEAMKTAESLLRQGHYSDSIAKCRLACESLARHLGGRDTKRGYAALQDKAFAPGHELGAAVNEALDALGKMSNACGRHAQVPHIVGTRDEALLALRSTMAIFAYVIPRLASSG